LLPRLHDAQDVELVGMDDRLDRAAGGDAAGDGQPPRRGEDLDPAAAVVAALDVAGLLQLPEMAQHRDLGDLEVVGDFLERGRISVALREVLHVAEDFQLLGGHGFFSGSGFGFSASSSLKVCRSCFGVVSFRSGGRSNPLIGTRVSPAGSSKSASGTSRSRALVTSNCSTTRSRKTE